MSLLLLQDYGSDEDDESKVEVKEKKINNNDNGDQQTELVGKPKDKEKLPLPAALRNMFSTSDDNGNCDNAENHGGRIRSFPHERGNWVSYVHIALNKSESICHQINTTKELFVGYPDLQFHFCEDLHLSLSRTVVLRHHWIDSFLLLLKDGLSSVNRFNIVYLDFQTYVNDDKTRTFIAMDVYPSSQLHQLVKISDTALAEFELEPYYEDPSFHVSLCWILGDKSNFIKETLIPVMNSKWRTQCDKEHRLQFESIDSIEFKTGNRLCSYQLN